MHHFLFKLHAKIQLLPHLRPSLCSPQCYNVHHNHSTRHLKIPTITDVYAFTTNTTATIISSNLFTASPHLQPPLPISLPQRFSHFPVTAATATNPLDTHHSLGGYRRNEDNENQGVSACNLKRKHALAFIRRRADSCGISPK